MVTCEKIAGVGSKCKGLDCPTTPCTGLSCKSLTKVNQTCQGVTSTGVKCLNGTGIIVPDGLDILSMCLVLMEYRWKSIWWRIQYSSALIKWRNR